MTLSRNRGRGVPVRPRGGWWLTALFILLVGPGKGLAAEPWVLEDSEWNFDTDWSIRGPNIEPTDAQNSDFTAERRASGGNPGAYLEVVHTLATVSSGGVGSWVAMINETRSFLPGDYLANGGPSISFELDVQRAPGTAGRTFFIVLRQDGYLWMATNLRPFILEDGWVNVFLPNMDRLDFFRFPGEDPAQPSRPNFSASGSEIHVGIVTGLSCPDSSDCSRVVPKRTDLDNFRVTVTEGQDFQITPGLNDAWKSDETPRSGFFVNVFEETGIIFLAWFTYEKDRPPAERTAIIGEPGHRWVVAQGTYEGDTATLDIFFPTGGVFDFPTPGPVLGDPVGTMTITWSDCNNAELSYDMPALGLGGDRSITRTANDNLDYCERIGALP